MVTVNELGTDKSDLEGIVWAALVEADVTAGPWTVNEPTDLHEVAEMIADAIIASGWPRKVAE